MIAKKTVLLYNLNVVGVIMELFVKYLCSFLALIIVLPLHEFAHAFSAVKSGDDTPKLMGRYSLNPLRHFDPLGLVCMVLVGFGWAKPVVVNPDNFKHRTLDSLWVAVSGVLTNLITAFLVYPLLILSYRLDQQNLFFYILTNVLYNIVVMSVVFAVFNFLPLKPLDGFRVIQTFTKPYNKFRVFMEKYSEYFLIVLVALDFMGEYLSKVYYGFGYMRILSMTIAYLGNKLLIPIGMFWGLIF